MDVYKKFSHIALYGNIEIERRYCSHCKRLAFVIDDKIQCCNRQVDAELKLPRLRISDVPVGRKALSKKARKEILEAQDFKCFYCERRFGAIVWRKQTFLRLRIEWDHVVPYCYSMNNYKSNFVGACHVCNRMKRGIVYETIDEYRIYLHHRWKEKAYSDVPPVP